MGGIARISNVQIYAVRDQEHFSFRSTPKPMRWGADFNKKSARCNMPVRAIRKGEMP
jgi:hypothetical protein